MSSFIGNKPFQVPTNSDLGRLAFLDYVGIEDFGSSIPTITFSGSNSTITVSSKVSFVSGTGSIRTISVPGELINGGQITLIPLTAFTTVVSGSGNIAIATTAEVNKPLTLTYDAVSEFWYPSYVNTSIYPANGLKQFTAASTSSSELAAILASTDITGSGKLVFATSPLFTNSISSATGTFDLINTNATTLNIGGAATIVKIGSIASGTTTVNYNLDVSQNITAGQNITAYNSSDKRLKENISPITNPLKKLLKLSGNTFKWSRDYYETQNQSLFKEYDVGVIAQEVIEVLPEAVHTRDNGILAVDYQKLIPLLIECIKAQQVQIDELKGIK